MLYYFDGDGNKYFLHIFAPCKIIAQAKLQILNAFLVAVPIAVIASFRKMKKLVQDNSLIETALWTSSQLVSLSSTYIQTVIFCRTLLIYGYLCKQVVSSDGKKVKRLHPLLDSNIEDAKVVFIRNNYGV